MVFLVSDERAFATPLACLISFIVRNLIIIIIIWTDVYLQASYAYIFNKQISFWCP
jgi:hypothetical protein